MILVGYLASIIMGLFLGLTGGGGSILTVPILVYLFKIPPVTATGYSLFIVGTTAFFGSLSYIKSKRVDFKTAFLFGVPSIVGVYSSRTLIVPALPNEIFHFSTWVFTKDLLIMTAFAVLMILASYSMIKNSNAKLPPGPHKGSLPLWRSLLLIVPQGLSVGVITGFVGAGGGFLIIPALVFLRGLNMRMAVGTSLFIITINSHFGFIGTLRSGSDTIDWRFLLGIVVLAIVGTFTGSALSSKIDEKQLKKAFGYFVLVMGMFILIQQLKGR